MPKPYVSPVEIAHFRFALIAPVIQCTYSEPSASAYYRRVTTKPLTLPDGSVFRYSPGTLENGRNTTRRVAWKPLCLKCAQIKVLHVL